MEKEGNVQDCSVADSQWKEFFWTVFATESRKVAPFEFAILLLAFWVSNIKVRFSTMMFLFASDVDGQWKEPYEDFWTLS